MHIPMQNMNFKKCLKSLRAYLYTSKDNKNFLLVCGSFIDIYAIHLQPLRLKLISPGAVAPLVLSLIHI